MWLNWDSYIVIFLNKLLYSCLKYQPLNGYYMTAIDFYDIKILTTLNSCLKIFYQLLQNKAEMYYPDILSYLTI